MSAGARAPAETFQALKRTALFEAIAQLHARRTGLVVHRADEAGARAVIKLNAARHIALVGHVLHIDRKIGVGSEEVVEPSAEIEQPILFLPQERQDRGR